jgi:transcriptional regulator with XRE-family HTH domain
VLQDSNGRVYVDIGAFHAALNSMRQQRAVSWRQVAQESGVSASTITRVGQGRRPDIDGLAALAEWGELSLNDYVRPSRRAQERPDTLSAISNSLHSDPNLDPKSAAALDDIVRTAYARFRNG